MTNLATPYHPGYAGRIRVPAASVPPIPLDERKVIARRVSFELPPNGIVNLGVGVPQGVASVANEEKVLKYITLSVESGAIGGIPASGASFGASLNMDAIIDENQQSDFSTAGGLDMACLRMAECDRCGNVNVSRFGTPGLTVSRTLDKHGWRSSDTAELHFEGCRIPLENRLGDEGRGFYAIMKNFQNERTTISAVAMGEAQAALELTLDYVRTRKAFGAPLWQRETIRQRLAMLATKVEAGRQLVYHTAWLDTQGVDATKEVSMVKAFCGELVNEVMYNCVQFHGGMGFMRGSTIERMARDARVQNIGGGATEVMLEEVAKRL